jgi:hypothetical protein
MSLGTSPFIWNGNTLKLKKVLDSYIQAKPECTEIPMTAAAYVLMLNSIGATVRKQYEQSLTYRGRRIVKQGKLPAIIDAKASNLALETRSGIG